LLAAILGGITTIGYGMAEDFPFWVILRSLWGLAWSLFKMGAFLLLLQMSSDENRGSFMGTYNGLYRLGSLFGMLLGGFFADLVGIKFISIFLGCLAFATVPFFYKYIPVTLELEVDHTKPKGILHSIQLFKESQLT
jgi:MFS family permease